MCDSNENADQDLNEPHFKGVLFQVEGKFWATKGEVPSVKIEVEAVPVLLQVDGGNAAGELVGIDAHVELEAVNFEDADHLADVLESLADTIRGRDTEEITDASSERFGTDVALAMTALAAQTLVERGKCRVVVSVEDA